MATQPQQLYTYDDLASFPDDNFRREIIDGELIVTPAPATRHQRVVLELGAALLAHTKEHGGAVYIAPTDVFFSETNVVEPDVLYLSPATVDRAERKLIRGAPDVVVEVSSPSTRRLELVRKRELYEHFGVGEYWYVDLDADRVEVYRRRDEGFATPGFLGRGDALTSPLIADFTLDVNELIGPAD